MGDCVRPFSDVPLIRFGLLALRQIVRITQRTGDSRGLTADDKCGGLGASSAAESTSWPSNTSVSRMLLDAAQLSRRRAGTSQTADRQPLMHILTGNGTMRVEQTGSNVLGLQ